MRSDSARSDAPFLPPHVYVIFRNDQPLMAYESERKAQKGLADFKNDELQRSAGTGMPAQRIHSIRVPLVRKPSAGPKDPPPAKPDVAYRLALIAATLEAGQGGWDLQIPHHYVARAAEYLRAAEAKASADGGFEWENFEGFPDESKLEAERSSPVSDWDRATELAGENAELRETHDVFRTELTRFGPAFPERYVPPPAASPDERYPHEVLEDERKKDLEASRSMALQEITRLVAAYGIASQNYGVAISGGEDVELYAKHASTASAVLFREIEKHLRG